MVTGLSFGRNEGGLIDVVTLLSPPSFLPKLSPVTICQRWDIRLLAEKSIPLYLVSRYGWLSTTLLCTPRNAEFRLYNVAVVPDGCAIVPPGPLGTLIVTAVYALGGAAI